VEVRSARECPVLVRLQDFRLEALPMLKDPNELNILESRGCCILAWTTSEVREGRGSLITSRAPWSIPDSIVDISMLYRRFERYDRRREVVLV
jgi:hypothetical protein